MSKGTSLGTRLKLKESSGQEKYVYFKQNNWLHNIHASTEKIIITGQNVAYPQQQQQQQQ